MAVNKTLSISILSGKGGVGKTNIALNLGYCLQLIKNSSLLLDCDLGLANVDVLLGLTPRYTMQDIMLNGLSPFDVVLPITPGGFDFLPAAAGLSDLSGMEQDMFVLLFQKLAPVLDRYNYMFFDLGAGVTPIVTTLAAISHMRIMVITPEPTSLTDSYALMKVLNLRHGITDFHVIVNQVASRKEFLLTCDRITAACTHFLGFTPQILGGVNLDKAIPEAVRRQKPLLQYSPNSPASKDLKKLVGKLVEIREEKLQYITKSPIVLSTVNKNNSGYL